MSIKIKLQLNAILGILLAVFIGGVLIISTNQIKVADAEVTRANQILTATSEMRFVTFDYLLNHNARALEQWNDKYQDITNLLTPTKNQTPAEQQILDDIMAQHLVIKGIFGRIVSDYQNQPPDQSLLSRQNPVDKQLISQLLLKQQTKVSDASKLVVLGQHQIDSALNRLNLLIFLAILTLFVLTALNSVFIVFTVSRSLALLQRGAQAIASGKFDYRIRKRRNDEFGDLATSFNSMATSLEDLDRIKSEFILLASHQLRTPLTAIKWSAEELLTPERKVTTKKRQYYLKQIQDSNERMIRLVSALLNAAKIESGSLAHTAEPVQLNRVCEEVLRDLAAQINDRTINLVKKIDADLALVSIDPTWMRAILQNLLTNAIKYSPAGNTVILAIKQEPFDVLISVHDRGYGIPEGQQSKIFTKLFRADNAQKNESEGNGLGLYITKAMVETAGGQIWFESVENQGTTFYVKLPVANAEQA